MLDVNHGSGFVYGSDGRRPIGAMVNDAIDAMLTARNRAQKPRTYVSTSGIGRECLRQIQYDYLATTKDEGADFEPGTLRIFAAGHISEDVVADWLKASGFDLRTHRSDGGQFGFSALDGRFKGHIDGAVLAAPLSVEMQFPALWETKALGKESWLSTVKLGVTEAKPIYAAQMALYQAYMEMPEPALFTALNRDTWELYCELVPYDPALAQRMSDRAVQVVQASDADELLPRVSGSCDAVICRGGWGRDGFNSPCAWRNRCWGLTA